MDNRDISELNKGTVMQRHFIGRRGASPGAQQLSNFSSEPIIGRQETFFGHLRNSCLLNVACQIRDGLEQSFLHIQA